MQQAMLGLRDHSLGCAIFSRIIAKKKGLKDPEEIFIFGLLHDIGKMVLVLNFPKEYAKVMEEAEKRKALPSTTWNRTFRHDPCDGRRLGNGAMELPESPSSTS